MDNALPSRLQNPVKPISRWRAASLHLLISILVALVVVGVTLFVWYPLPYFYGLDGFGLLMLLVSVDVVIGPLITLVIFNPAKKSLKFDLAVVAALQLVALAYGVHTMFQARPVYAVFNENRFDVVIDADISAAEQAKATNPRFQRVSLLEPELVAMDPPKDSNEVMRIMNSGINSRAFPQHYVPYEDRAKEAAKAAKPLHLLAVSKPESAAKVREFIAQKSIEEAKIGWLPFYTRANDMTIVLEKETGKIVGIVPVAPE
jgi:hypothetical protein